MTSGVIGSFIGTPTEVCLIRMTSDGRLSLSERRNYTNVFNALFRIFREEGLTALWRGAIPTMGRAAVVNGAQLASYSYTEATYSRIRKRVCFRLASTGTSTARLLVCLPRSKPRHELVMPRR
ncbi:hypothetical protein AHF37_06319 [Paragonimus kellicotti]|nr:hypothetical protein AHF37_06319 [Paragonimus kellicotti]